MSEPRMIERVCFVAPSTGLCESDRKALRRTIRAIMKNMPQIKDVHFGDSLFTYDQKIQHTSGPTNGRYADFQKAIKEFDLVISVAGGTGAEDLVLKLKKKDFKMIAERQPVFMGFSDFTFLLNELYYFSEVPVIYFTSLTLGKGNFKKIFSLISGKEIDYKGSFWLTAPPARQFSGIPIGGNLSTFVNFLNRSDPPKYNWSKYVLFIEEFQVDREDLHRFFAALNRHKIFDKLKCLVVGSLTTYAKNPEYKARQKKALEFLKDYLADILRKRVDAGNPLPILAVSNFGHNIIRYLMAVPIGGYVTINKGKKIVFKMKK